jgi:superfamily II DNA or RNA helicase
MVDLVKVEYAQTGKSSSLNPMGMREMQARAFEARDAQYLLLKAPPASGKSRALMFLGLDKLKNQGIKKVIVAVPETSIGSSFKDVKLTADGFYADWHVDDRNNLCVGGESGKVNAFIAFLKHPTDEILVCTHATLRFAYEKLNPSDFNDTLVAIDEFHHVSAGEESKLGQLIDGLIKGSNAHIVAMTGSYFRGDAVPILLPEDEALFKQVTYSYYEQLNGYQYLKSLGIGYHFYKGRYLDALHEVLDPNKKTIIHIPNVNAVESTKDKYREVEDILDVIGTNPVKDSMTGIISITAPNGVGLKVADLVDDNVMRPEIQKYLREVNSADDIDIIIALGMAKEGFDWPWCEHVLTIGYRSSMTEIVQIIGRATRDCKGKSHAQFTNLIAQPDAEDGDVKVSVNNMLKAITVSLLMENVLAPNINFRPRSRLFPDEQLPPGTVIIEDVTAPVSDRVLQALDNLDNIRAALIQKPEVAAAAIVQTAPEVINDYELPKIIETMYPDLTPAEVDTVKEAILTQMVVQNGGGLFEGTDLPPGAEVFVPPGATTRTGQPVDVNSLPKAGQQFVKMGNKFINIEHLNIDLIGQVNPFQGAYEILSKAFTTEMLKSIQEVVVGMRASVTDEEAVIFWPRIEDFFREHGKEPSLTSADPLEKRYAEVLAFMRRKKQEGMSKNGD